MVSSCFNSKNSMIPQECGSGHDATIIRKRNAMRYTNMKMASAAIRRHDTALLNDEQYNLLKTASAAIRRHDAALLNDEQYNISWL
jgi:hypothetical protein